MSDPNGSATARFYDRLYAWKPYAAEADALHALLRARGVPDGGTLLDVGCGTGAHLEHLGRHYRVEGVDLDPQMLARARERCPGAAFHAADMADFDLGRTFDAVTCLFSAIGYVLTAERLRSAAATFARHLRPGGVLALEPWLEPEGFAGRPRLDSWEDDALKVARVGRTLRLSERVSAIEFHFLVGSADGIEHVRELHELGLFTRAETVEALEAAGFGVEHDAEGLMGRGLYLAVRR